MEHRVVSSLCVCFGLTVEVNSLIAAINAEERYSVEQKKWCLGKMIKELMS